MRKIVFGVFALTIFWALPGSSQDRFKLDFPLNCEVGISCFIQQYVDLDPSDKARDYTCGAATYEGHKGTDFRVRTTKHAMAGVEVLAAAPGRVVGMRDGMDDHLLKSGADRAAVKNRECGNGVTLRHEQGWETQYCHMRSGSIRVKNGQKVSAGQALGQLGYSGRAEFPHLHFSVRKNGDIIDPFSGQGPGHGCGATPDEGLWNATLRTALSYEPTQVLAAGFAGEKLTLMDLETGQAEHSPVKPQSPVLISYFWAINLLKGDRISVVISRPEGVSTNKVFEPLPRAKAQFMQYAGRVLKTTRWPEGVYRVIWSVERDGSTVIKETRTLKLE